MCSAVRYEKFFARNLDLWCEYGQKPILTKAGELGNRFALLGMGIRQEGYPLYFDGMNERGLAAAALNFPDFAEYAQDFTDNCSVASYELIPRVLGGCESVEEAKKFLCGIRITNKGITKKLPPSPLHWMIADKSSSIVVESTKKGLRVYDNHFDVLTNSPDFEIQSFNLNNYIALTSRQPNNTFPIALHRYSQGMGALGLPGDLSSMSRFVRLAFHLHHSPKGLPLSHVFSLLNTVSMPKGSVVTEKGELEYTRYSACFDLLLKKCFYRGYNDTALQEFSFK